MEITWGGSLLQFYPKGCMFVSILGCYNPGGKAVLLTANAIQHPVVHTALSKGLCGPECLHAKAKQP